MIHLCIMWRLIMIFSFHRIRNSNKRRGRCRRHQQHHPSNLITFIAFVNLHSRVHEPKFSCDGIVVVAKVAAAVCTLVLLPLNVEIVAKSVGSFGAFFVGVLLFRRFVQSFQFRYANVSVFLQMRSPSLRHLPVCCACLPTVPATLPQKCKRATKKQ